MNQQEIKFNNFIEQNFDKLVLPYMKKYLSIKNISKAFDKNWESNKF
jgi:hypothetical protein